MSRWVGEGARTAAGRCFYRTINVQKCKQNTTYKIRNKTTSVLDNMASIARAIHNRTPHIIHSSVHKSIPQYNKAYHSTQEFTTVQQSIPQYTRVYHSTTKHTTVHKSTPQYNKTYLTTSRMYHIISLYTRVYHSIPWPTTMYHNIPRSTTASRSVAHRTITYYSIAQHTTVYHKIP